jgi:L-lactate dehydrogenase (cytochrome)
MPLITSIEDLRLAARRRVPRMFYDYVDSGSWTESTYRANEHDLAAISFRQRVAVDIENRSIRSTMIGEDVAMPVALAPTGLCGMQHADGEILAARAAEAFGVPFCVSTMSICSIEDVATNATKPLWFQLYVMRNRDFVERLIGRATQAQCSALLVTLDLPLAGQRHKVLRNGLSVPPRLTIANLIDMAMKPKWCLEMLRTRRRIFGNLVGYVDGVSDMTSLLAWIDQQFDPRLSWDDILDPQVVGGKAGAEGNHGCRRCAPRDRRRCRCDCRIQPRWPATRRGTFLDSRAAHDREGC